MLKIKCADPLGGLDNLSNPSSHLAEPGNSYDYITDWEPVPATRPLVPVPLTSLRPPSEGTLVATSADRRELLPEGGPCITPALHPWLLSLHPRPVCQLQGRLGDKVGFHGGGGLSPHHDLQNTPKLRKEMKMEGGPTRMTDVHHGSV